MKTNSLQKSAAHEAVNKSCGDHSGQTAHSAPNKRALSIGEFTAIYGVGRSTAYAEMSAGRLEYVKCGRRRLIPVDSAEAWLQRLKQETA